MSPNFERLHKTLLLRGEPDRVPLAELNVESDVKGAFLGRPIRSLEDEVEFWATAGYDYLPLRQGLRTILGRGSDARQAAVQAPSSAAGQVIRERMSRVGHARYSLFADSESERVWAEEGKGVITNRAELESFPWPRVEEMDWSRFEQVRRHLPPGMKVIGVLGYVYASVSMLMGVETFFIALLEDPDLVARMFDTVGTLQYECLERMVSYDAVGAIWMPDDIAYYTSTMVAPKYLRQYVFPWYKRMGDLCKSKGLPFIYHSDGCLYEVFEDLITCGYNAIHPIEPKAMDIVRLKKTYGDRVCLIGNIDLAYTLTLGTPQEVEEQVKERLREVAPGGGYCVGSSNSVTEYVPLANYNAMRETVLKYGTYPIRI